MAQQQGFACTPRLEGPPEGVVARPVDGGAQLAAAPGEPHAAGGNALERTLQVPDGALDPPCFPQRLAACVILPQERPLPMWTASAMNPLSMADPPLLALAGIRYRL